MTKYPGKTVEQENPAQLPLSGAELVRAIQDGADVKLTTQAIANLSPPAQIATTSRPGIVQPDGTTITVSDDGVITSVGGGRTVLTADTTFYVSDFFGAITSGAAYTDGWYLAVAMTGGHGSGATANIRVRGGAVVRVALVTEGAGGYEVNDVLSANAADIGGTGAGFSVLVALAGSDVTGNGSVSAPWATLQNASNNISGSYEIRSPTLVTVQVGDGAYNGFNHIPITGTGSILWQGNGAGLTDARKVQITENANNPGTVVTGSGSYSTSGIFASFKQFNYVGPLSQDQGYFGCSGANLGNFDGSYNVFSESNFGDAIYNINNTTQQTVVDNIVFDGTTYSNWDELFNCTSSQMQLSATVTFLGINVSTGVGAYVFAGGLFDMVSYGSPTFVGSYSGANAQLTAGATVTTNGAGVNLFPGNPGSTFVGVGCSYNGNKSSVAGLPNPNSTTTWTVTDALSPSSGAIVAGGGSSTCEVFSDGTNWRVLESGRRVLTVDTTYYVSTTGSDSNDGSSGSPWATLQHAIIVVAFDVSIQNCDVTIQLEDGSYDENPEVYSYEGQTVSETGVTIQGNSGTPSNVKVQPTSGGPNTVVFFIVATTPWNYVHFEVDGSLATDFGFCDLFVPNTGTIMYSTSLVFGEAYGGGAWFDTFGSCSVEVASGTSNGLASNMLFGGSLSQFNFFGTITFLSDPAFDVALIVGPDIVNFGSAVSGAVTGTPYKIEKNGVLIWAGQTIGNVPGVVESGTVVNQSTNPSLTGRSGNRKSGPPLASNIPENTFNVFKDTTKPAGFGVTLDYNDAGTLVQFFPDQIATSNLTFYVSTTGSDSNPGTSGSPFATLQHAVNVAASYDYQLLYTWTINVDDGTYTVSTNAVVIPPFVNLLSNSVQTIEGNTGSPGNVVLKATNGVTQVQDAITNQLVLDGFTVHLTAGFRTHFLILGGSCLYGNLAVDSDAALVGISVFHIGTSGQGNTNANLDTNGGYTVTVNSGVSFYYFNFGAPGSNNQFNFTQFNFPASLTVHGAWLNGQYAQFNWAGNTYANFAGVHGSQCDVSLYAILITDNAVLSDLPGDVAGYVDNSVTWINNNTGVRALAGIKNVGTITGSDIPYQSWQIAKDTTQPTGFGVSLTYNDNGTLVEFLPFATSNVTFYVSTTGSDSNPGTSGSPFATVQHAADVASSYDWAGAYNPTIQIEDGTYDQLVSLPVLTNTATGFDNWTGGPLGGYLYGNLTDPTLVNLQPSTVTSAGPGTGGAIEVSGTWIIANIWSDCSLLDAASLGMNGNVVLGIGAILTSAIGQMTTGYGNQSLYYQQPGSFLYYDQGDYNNNTLNIIPGPTHASCFAIFEQSGTCYGFSYSLKNLLGNLTTIWLYLQGNNNSFTLYGGYALNGHTLGNYGPVTLSPGSVLIGDPGSVPVFNTGASSHAPTVATGANYFGVTTIFPPVFATPSNGDTVTMDVLSPILILKPSGGLATLTLDLPINPFPSQYSGGAYAVSVSTTQAIAALTLATTDGSAVLAAPTALTAGQAFKMTYDTVSNTWYPTI